LQTWTSADGGRFECRTDIRFGGDWNGKHYETRQVRPIFVEEATEIVVVTVYTHRVQVFGMPWQGRRRFWIAHPSIPSRWEGKKYRLSNHLFPLPTGGGEGVGDPIQTLPSVPAPISCTRWVYVYYF
jgi:hypothetical protein